MEGLRWVPRAMSRAVVFLAALHLAAVTAQQKLPGHSVAIPVDLNAMVANWWLAGTVIPSGQNTVLSPGVRNRVGMMWSKSPLLTNNFEATFSIRVRKPAKKTSTNGGFAFWLTPENATEVQFQVTNSHIQKQEEIIADTWGAAMKDKGFDLLGYRSKFNGLGVIFVDDDAPSVSVVPNDGSKALQIGAGIPTYDAMKFNWVADHEFKVKVTILPESAQVDIVGGPSATVKGDFKKSGFSYMGFTAFGGNVVNGVSEHSSPFVELASLDVVNLDTSAKGEEVRATPPPTLAPPLGEKVDVFAEASSFKDHRAESDAIKELTNMVFKLVVETQPARQQMARSIETLSKRIEAMEASFGELKAELDKKTGHKLGEEFEAIKKELTTLSTVASKETQERHSRLESLHADIADVHKSAHSPETLDRHLDKLTESNTKVLDQLNNEHQTMFGVSLGAIAFIVIAGLSLYNKFRCWEKKHVL